MIAAEQNQGTRHWKFDVVVKLFAVIPQRRSPRTFGSDRN
jgi:hypothetical protein